MTTGICFTDTYDLQTGEGNPAHLDVKILHMDGVIECVNFCVKGTDKDTDETQEIMLSLSDVKDLVYFLNQRALGNV